MYLTKLYFAEADLNGKFDSHNPHMYRLKTDAYPTMKQLENIIFQAIEIEGMCNNEFLFELVIEKDGICIGHKTAVIRPSVVTTNRPSNFFAWGDKEPNVFEIDRAKSKLEIC